MYTVCASAVISPLRQWLDSYAKTRLKMCDTFKHYMQNFLLLTNLVIVFVHWVSTDVLYEPRQCSLFWDYIPESKFCFCVNLCRPSGPYSIRPIQKLLNCQAATRDYIHPDGEQPKPALWLGVREMTWYLYTRGVRGRMKANDAVSKLLENCVMNGGMVSSCSASCSWRPLDWRIRHSYLTSTLFHSLVNPAPENSPQSIAEIRNGCVANLQELLYQTG